MSCFHKDALAGRRVLITGGATGICRGIARAYLLHGARVAIVSRKQEALEKAAAELEAECGSEVSWAVADVRDYAQVEAAVAKCSAALGGLDTLVNGAAGNFIAPVAGLSANGFRTVVDIDLCGTFNASRAAFAALCESGDGLVLNISATLHYGGTPGQSHAAAAKAGVDAFSKTLAAEWGPRKIRVNVIAPGPIEDTEGMKRLLPPALKAQLESNIPLGRLGRIHDVAQMSVFLRTAAASFVTGAVFVVDGGDSLRIPFRFTVPEKS